MIDPQELTTNKQYDLAAANYSLRLDTQYEQYIKYLLVKNHARSSDILLDIGIANGNIALHLFNQVKEIHGVDISPKMLEECQKNARTAGAANIHTYARSATDLRFNDNAFDLAYSFSTLLMIPDIYRAFDEMARVTRPGGIIILDIAGKRNPSWQHWNQFYKKLDHFGTNAFRLEEIRTIFTSYDWKIIETHAFGAADQYKYRLWHGKVIGIPFLDKLLHWSGVKPDLEYRLSQRFPQYASRWYFVLENQKPAAWAGANSLVKPLG